MRAGNLRHLVELQEQTSVDDGAGGSETSYVPRATMWADITATSGREFFQAKTLMPELTHQVEIRYRTDVKPGMRFVEGQKVYRIQAAPDPEGRQRRLLCMCQELVQ